MSSKTIRYILLSMVLIVSALFITQAYWFKKSFSLQERQLDEQLNVALRKVAHQLLMLNNDTTSRIPPITKTASNEYYVRTRTYFSLATLDRSLRKEFGDRNIVVDFDYLILESQFNQIILGNTLFGTIDSNLVACKAREDSNADLDFKIRINNKSVHLIQSMGIWMYSSISLLILIAVFAFIYISILKSKKLSELKKDFVNNMTHELKTPITNISVASDAIRNKSVQMDQERLEKYAEIIYNENVRLHSLVDTVLQISAIEKNTDSLTFEPVDVHSLIQKAILNFEPVIQQQNGELKSSLNAHDFLLQLDKTHISNVFYNLIENAIKYSNKAPEIKVTTINTSDGLIIEVSDNGIGISKENHNRIFEQFFRAESGNIHTTKGYGLGLSYVKLIIERHHGTITFKSKKSVGTTFKIFLPL